MKKIHFILGISISVFVALHLINHVFSLIGAEKHIEIMQLLRPIYRNFFSETLLLIAAISQIFSGITLFKTKRKIATNFYNNLQIWTGLYLAIFLVIHVGAVMAGRHVLKLDTNYYFGVAGLNTYPFHLFFIPYYALAIISFFGHMAAIHSQKMRWSILGLKPNTQAHGILIFGICLTIIIFYGLTNHFKGVIIPKEYHILIGK